MNEESEWELSKENVQPIRQGRHLSNLSAGLQSSEDQLAQMRKEKHEFESELRTYSGDDPVEVWHRYLVWTEQNCVKGGKEYNLEKLLENYLKQFAEETRYHNDPRYVSAWIRYANMCKEPTDIYNYMFDQKIGCTLCCFYESWAWAMEQMGNTKKANMIFQEGVKRRAEPFDILEKKYNNFQMRVARGLAGKVLEDAPEESIEHRAALGQISTKGRKVSVNRAENTKPKSKGLGLQAVKPGQIGQTFKVFNDENQDPSLPGQLGDWNDVPSQSSVNKENEKKAGVWTKARVPCKAVAPPAVPSFSLYVEENADQPMTTPRKLPEVGNQVLSARKPTKPVDNLQNLRHETSDPTQRPMYCKDKVYSGAEEYSLEEIRAAKWFDKKRREEDRKRVEEEQRLLEEQREQLRRNREMLQQEAENFRLQQENLKKEQQAFLEQYKSDMQRQHEEFKRERELMIQKQKDVLEREIEEKKNAGLAAASAREKTSSKHLNFSNMSDVSMKSTSSSSDKNVSLHRKSPNNQPTNQNVPDIVVPSTSSESGFTIFSDSATNSGAQQSSRPERPSFTQGLPPRPAANRGLQSRPGMSFKPFVDEDQNKEGQDVQNTSYRTPSNRLGLNSSGGNKSGHTPSSGGRLSLSAPSPTVNTKEAMQLVMGMFNASLDIDANLGWDDDTDMVTAPPQETEEMSSIVDFAERRYGTEFVAGVGPSGDGMIEHQKLVTRNQQLEQERVVSLQRETETSIQHEREMTEIKARVEEKNRSLKQARRQRDHWKKMTDKEKAKYEELSRQHVVSQDAEARIQQMSSTIEELQRDRVNLRAQVRYHKGLEGREPNTAVFSRRIDQLKEEVEFWQGQYLECQEQMDAFLNQREVVTFHQGKYIDVIREVYMELMCMRVGAKNVPKIIRTVMEKMTGITPQRLPGTTFAKYMLLEARSVALTHLKEEIQSSAGNLTVGPDGTTKFGHHYGAISLSFSGKTMCMGLRDMACGDAEAYQRLLEGIVTEMTGDDLEQIRQIAVKVKNTVSDQASVNKKFVTLLTEWRERALPHVVENWDTLTVPQKERYININYFFCGLHFLVGLSEQANKTLSLWESLVHPGEKVGAPSLPGGYSKAGESGTTRLVRTVCKAVQDRGCEKAGKPVEFRDYLQTQGQVKEVPLASFKGNRFNILFHNAAGVYYLLDDLLSFAEEHKADNKLFAAVNADVHVLSFQAGVRALGIVSKMVTGPMWRFMEKNGHVSELTPVYQQLYSAFKRLSRDASSLMRGEEYIFGEEMVQKDDVYNSLVSPSLELDDLTRQILELLFSSFEVVCSRQLKDHIEGGKYAAGWSPELLEESTSVPRTNVGPERIFAQLDSLLRVMPRATTNAIEGITMWTQNHTGSWLASLEEEHREQVLRNAREESREQRQMFVERLAAIRQERQEALATKREKKEAKEQRDRERKEELTQKLQEVGGLWTTVDEVDRKVRTLPVGQRVKALQTQVTFRRYVLGTPNTGKILNVMAGGKYLSAERLASNLKCVLRQAQDAREERQQEQQVSGQANPLSDFCLQAEKEKFQQLAEAERQKNAEGPKKKQKTQKGRLPSTQTTAPELTDPEQLIGKRVQHLVEEEDTTTKWYDAIVTGLKKRRAPKPSMPNAPFSIFTDNEMETDHAGSKEKDANKFSNKSTDFIGQRKRNNSRGALQSVSKENVEAMEFEGRLEMIESQARDDFTICPIGTNQSFSAAARVASTPFNRDRPLDPLNDVSRINSHVEQSGAKSSLQILADTQSVFHTSKDEVKDLSPIMEGSNEESSGHHGQSTMNSVFKTSSHVPMETEKLQLPKYEDLNQSTHVIDTTQYIPSPASKDLLLPRNPFDEKDTERHLKSLSRPLNTWPNYFERDELLPEIKKDNTIELGDDTYIAEELIAKGGYAKVFKISMFDYMLEGEEDEDKTEIAMKVQTPPCPWEFYICNELHTRLSDMNNTVDVRPAMMNARKGYFFENCSCILTDFFAHGTLLDLVNKLTNSNASVGEPLAMYVTIELLYMIEYLHKCQIIHGDIKPDNFLLIDIPKLPKSTDPNTVFGGSSRCLQLIDFGQSIDMSKYPKGTTFSAKVKTSGFQCIEMQTNRAWTYQTDLFGLVGTVHVLVFRKYMQVYQNDGEWKTTSSFVRSWNTPLWKKLFHECLNIPSCDQQPDITKLRMEFENYFINNLLDKYNSIQSMLVYQVMK